jgi:hypothetical protein
MASDSTGEAPVQSEVHPGPPKGLLFLVKAMAVILVLLFLGLIGGIIYKATTRTPAAAVSDIAMDLKIDPASIRLMELDGNTLALTTDKEIIVVDVKQRKVLLRSGVK